MKVYTPKSSQVQHIERPFHETFMLVWLVCNFRNMLETVEKEWSTYTEHVSQHIEASNSDPEPGVTTGAVDVPRIVGAIVVPRHCVPWNGVLIYVSMLYYCTKSMSTLCVEPRYVPWSGVLIYVSMLYYCTKIMSTLCVEPRSVPWSGVLRNVCMLYYCTKSMSTLCVEPRSTSAVE